MLLVASAQQDAAHLFVRAVEHPHAAVRQSGYALVGDMAMNCFPLLRQYIPSIMQELISQLDPEPKVEFVSACNNAAWAVGEIALRYGRGRFHFFFPACFRTFSPG